MERLTIPNEAKYCRHKKPGTPTWQAIELLAELEDKLESGELLELPCKVGDTVWYIEYGYCFPNLSSRLNVKPIIVTEISWKRNRSGKDLGFSLIANGTRYKFSSIGKTVFLTKEAAEARLKELAEIKVNK